MRIYISGPITGTKDYKERFASLDASFKDRMIQIDNLNRHISDEKKEKLLSNYFAYFKINANIAHNIKNAKKMEVTCIYSFHPMEVGDTSV